jgi:16S rRNA (cytosine1402-N4)-methyltransferase
LSDQPKNYEHVPVLLNEVISYLDPKLGQNFIDATLGGGGYSKKILEHIGDAGKLLSIDLDSDAIEATRIKNKELGIKNWIITQGNFSHVDHIARNHQFLAPDGIVADLGLSSYELDQSGRGISFQKKEPLDMRFDQHGNTVDARFILNNYGQKQLEKIFNDYGEEKFSRQIAKKILDTRSKVEVHYTTDLYNIIVDSLPKPVKHKADDSARRIFQALRIEVNHELQNLEEFLPKAFDLLSPGGRLVIVSFHSLEDRIVKQFFVGLTKGCVCPIDFPQCVCGKNPQGKILTKKVIVASGRELKDNPRSNAAKLRAIMKL